MEGTAMSDSKILTSEEVEKIESRKTNSYGSMVNLPVADRDDICATVRHLLSENEKLRARILELETDIDTERGYL